MKKCFYFCCWLLVIGCADGENEEIEINSPYAGNYEFSFHTYQFDPMGSPANNHSWDSKSMGTLEAKSENILVVKTNNVADFEIEPDDNKEFSSKYEIFESGTKVYIEIEGKFDSLNNLSVRYIHAYANSSQQTHTITGIKTD